MDDVTRLKKQVKLLFITTITLAVLTVGLLVTDLTRSKSTESLPDLTVGKLTVKEVRVVAPDGEVRMLMHTNDNAPVFALIDQAAEVRVLLSAGTKQGGFLNIVGPDKANKLSLSSGFILMGDEAQSSLRLIGPSGGGPSLMLRDENGFSTTIGRTTLKDNKDGTQSFTSAAYIVASSKESTLQYPLLKTAVTPK